jgi:hypothetical protein
MLSRQQFIQLSGVTLMSAVALRYGSSNHKKPQFANYLGINDRRPDLVVRFGRGAKMSGSLRRSLETVIV